MGSRPRPWIAQGRGPGAALLIALAGLVYAHPVRGQEPAPGDSAAVEPRPQETPAPPAPPPEVPAGLRIGGYRLPFPWPIDVPTNDSEPGRPGRFWPWQTGSDWLREESLAMDSRLEARRDTMWWVALELDKLPRGFDRRAFYRTAPGLDETFAREEREDRQRINIIPDALRGIADLELEVGGQGQLGSQWQNFSPCTVGIGQQCNASAVPDLRPEFQLRAIARGTISERVHVDVDFDQTREFVAANNLNVYYEGKPDEILKFVELGQVSLPLPSSNYISQAIPAGNFGVRGDARFGPLDIRGVFAEQKGSVENRRVTLEVGGPEGGILQDVETVLDDAAYASGQFYFVVDPRELAGYPLIDVINLQGSEAPSSLRPGSSIKLYRHEVSIGQPQNVESGVIQARAVAVRPVTADPTLPDSVEFNGFFRPLVEGEDFIVHRSGLWVNLRSRVLRDEALAVAYVSESGAEVGDFDAEAKFREYANTGTGDLPRLVLL